MKKIKYRTRLSRMRHRVLQLAGAAIVIAGLLSPTAVAAASEQMQTERARIFSAASEEFGVPTDLLLAISHNESRWETHGASPSVDNGYGLMDLRAKIIEKTFDGRGDPTRPAPTRSSNPANTFTLDEAAALLHVPAATLKNDDKQNVRGGAAVLAAYARQTNNGRLPGSTKDWYAAVAKYSGARDAESAKAFADRVFATMENGAALTTSDHQRLSIAKTPVLSPNRSAVDSLGLSSRTLSKTERGGGNQQVDCPRTVNCRFIPAAYAGTDPNDPTQYGNYDPANRPQDMKIKYIVIHDTEGSYESAVSWFQNSLFADPPVYVSANYVIRSSDGEITEMVHPGDVAWHAGNWYMNMHSIGLEHEGVAAEGGAWYTEEMYQSSAKLVRYLAKKYDIPLDRQHIIGHDNISRLSPARQWDAHWDPGPYWDWDHYMDLLHAGDSDGPSVTSHSKALTISPNFATNKPLITKCTSGTCADLPAQGSNIVYLHTEPSDTSPLLSDQYLHPDNSPGTTRVEDWSATANQGSTYATAGQQGDWTAIWYGGKKGWFYNPSGANKNAHVFHGKVASPRSGLASVQVYAGAYPEAAAFPSTIPVQNLAPLYTIPAGQAYTIASTKEPTDYFYDATVDYSLPDDHMIVRGNEKYYRIMFNHRFGYVKASDVTVKTY